MQQLLLLVITALAVQAQTIHVDDDATPGGDGSGRRPFNDLLTAVAYANTLSTDPMIRVAPGTYVLTETLLILRGMTISGSNELEFDSDGLPTGNLINPYSDTRIVGGPAITAMMINAEKDGAVIAGVKLRRLTLQSGPANRAVLDFARVQDFEVRDCVLFGFGPLGSGAVSGINTFASSGTIRNTYSNRLLGAAFIGAGYPASPGNVIFRDNRAVGNREGIFLVGTSDGITEPGDRLTAEIRHNDLSFNVEHPASAGIRIILKGLEGLGPSYGGTGLETGNVYAVIRNNRLIGNRVGIVIDAGFARRRAGAVCDTRTYHGQFDLSFRENELANSALVPSLISFTQFQTTLNVVEGLAPNYTNFQFLHFTTFNIDDPDGLLGSAFVHHPPSDPFVGGPCAADITHELLNNTLRINGAVVANTAP